MGERRLVEYLLLPRPYDALCKAPLALMAYGLVWVSGSTDRAPIGPTLAAWVLFELVLYQSRYTLNDLADADLDRLHVAAAARGRLPSGPTARRWARRAVVLRALTFLPLAAALPTSARLPTLVAAAGFVAATASYERARAPMRHPTPDSTSSRLAVIGLVGAGYAVRIGFGAGLAGARGGSLVAMVAFGWAFGTLGVVMAWTLEAAGLRSGADTVVLSRKAHIATIAELIGDDPAALAHPLLIGNGARLAASLLATSAATAIAVGATLDPSVGPASILALGGACAVAAPVLMATWPTVWAGVAATALAVTVAAAVGPPELVLLTLTITATVAAARTFTPATIDLHAVPSGVSEPQYGG